MTFASRSLNGYTGADALSGRRTAIKGKTTFGHVQYNDLLPRQATFAWLPGEIVV